VHPTGQRPAGVGRHPEVRRPSIKDHFEGLERITNGHFTKVLSI